MKAQKIARAAGVAVALAFAVCVTAFANPARNRQLGATFRIVSPGNIATVEVTLRPRTSFDVVRVEAGSGVQSLTPPCSFAQVVEGGFYVCRVNVTQKPGEASMTLNVIGEKTVDPAKPRLFAMSHFTIANRNSAAPAHKRSRRPTPGLRLMPPPGSTKGP